MPPEFVLNNGPDVLVWARIGWVTFLVAASYAALIYLRLGVRVVRWLATRDRSDWVKVWTQLFFSRSGSGYLYLLNSQNQVIGSERACLVVLADEEEGPGSSASLVASSGSLQRGRITYHRCLPKKNPPYGNIIVINGKEPANWDIVGYHAGSFIFSPHPICSSLLAALRKTSDQGQAMAPPNDGASQ